MSNAFRFIVEVIDNKARVYSVTSQDERGRLVAEVYDEEVLELLLKAPATRQKLNDNILSHRAQKFVSSPMSPSLCEKKLNLGNAIATRNKKQRRTKSISGFCKAFMHIVKKIK